MKEMYKGKAFSPLTVLTKPINALETSIEVEDSSLLPTAPNYATIGDSETIKYGAVAGNILTDCIRGVEGEAAAHEINEKISRLFTALDYDTLLENVEGIPAAIADKVSEHNTATDAHQDLRGSIDEIFDSVGTLPAVMDSKLNTHSTDVGAHADIRRATLPLTPPHIEFQNGSYHAQITKLPDEPTFRFSQTNTATPANVVVTGDLTVDGETHFAKPETIVKRGFGDVGTSDEHLFSLYVELVGKRYSGGLWEIALNGHIVENTVPKVEPDLFNFGIGVQKISDILGIEKPLGYLNVQTKVDIYDSEGKYLKFGGVLTN